MKSESRRRAERRSRSTRAMAWGLVCAAWGAGCSTYEDGLTGRFVEVLADERQACFERRECTAISVDFFRFGDYSQAIVREYRRSLQNTVDDPFVEPERCVWTSADRFDDEAMSFDLAVRQRSAEASVVRGTLVGVGDELSLEVINPSAFLELPDAQGLQLQLRRDDTADPVAGCATIPAYLYNARLSGELPASAQYTIEHPVFALVWLGFDRVETESGTVFFPTRSSPEHWLRLTGVSDGDTLFGRVPSVQVSPPEERFLIASGDTRLGLAHPLVIDDAEPSGSFAWDTESEPLIATGFRAVDASYPGASRLEEPRVGRAILFVEGRLDELDDDLQTVFSPSIAEYAYPEEHFYDVEILADGGDVVAMYLPETRLPPSPVLRLDVSYLSGAGLNLPRLYPSSGF